MNGHVNNVWYLRWALAAVPPAVSEAAALRAVNVEFRAEALLGQTVTARAYTAAGPGTEFVHSVSAGGGGRGRGGDGGGPDQHRLGVRGARVWRAGPLIEEG